MDRNKNKDTFGPHQEDHPVLHKEPVFNVPPVTLALVFLNVFIYAARYILDPSFYDALLYQYAFIPFRLTEAAGLVFSDVLTFITHMFLHGNGLHILMNGTMLLAIGSGIEKVMGWKRYVVFYFLCGILAVMFHFVFYYDDVMPLIGASGAISGLFGGVFVLMQRMGRFKPGINGLLPIIIIWTAFNVVIGLIGIPGEDLISIGWVAHLGGFYAGILLFQALNREEKY